MNQSTNVYMHFLAALPYPRVLIFFTILSEKFFIARKLQRDTIKKASYFLSDFN